MGPKDKALTHRHKKTGSRIRVAVAWTGTVGLLAYLLATTNLTEAWEAVRQADIALFAGAVVVFNITSFLAQTASACVLVQRCGIDISHREFRRIRGVSSLPSAVSYALSLATMTTLLSRRSSQGWFASSSPFLLLNFIDLSALSLLALLAVASGFSSLGREMNLAVGLFAVAGFAAGPVLIIILRLARPPAWLLKFVKHDMLSAFSIPSPGDLAWVFLLRAACFALKFLEILVYLSAFGFTVPFWTLMVLEPIMIVVGILPISVGGFGSIQVAARELFAGFAPAGLDPIPTVDAFSTAVMTGILLVRVAIGLWYAPSTISRLDSGPSDRTD
ncbi:MAG: hypothetical protein GXP54_02740 [Deltaproteobacteria bacterium]|nr:hypothetical protein [Deltaproteobacteria bacterium]